MHRACETKDQTLKKIRTLHFPDCRLKKREGVPELGTKPLKALRGYRASNRGSKGL